jgi:uncharacterized protein (TIGR02996 family)
VTDEDFIAAVVASPDDRALRAVYADWLEQRGDARAELVRIEDELWKEPIDLVRFRRLLPRRNQLRDEHDPQWGVRIARPSFAEIRRRVACLAALDPNTTIESADRHKYQLNPPASEAEVAAVEARIGGRLPEQYRRFVTELADGGCGPAYGIQKIADLDGDPAQPFQPPTTVAAMKRVTFDGACTVCEVGCGIYYYLILSGSDAGVIWYSGDGTNVPVQANGSWADTSAMLTSPRSARAEFIDWYVQWLDETLWRIARARPDADDVFDRPPEQVTDVNLGGRKLTALPTGLRRLTEVRRLDLQSNPLEQLPAWIGALAKLEWISLSYSGLRELPEQIGELRVLRRLSCFKAKALEKLPTSLGTLSALDDLDLRYCAIRELPESIGDLTQLAELQIHNNPLSTLPRSVGKLRKLRKLELSFCRIRSLPDEIAELPELVEIDLRANELVELPAAISKCTRLEMLSLIENPKLDLAGAFRILQHLPLRRLYLSSMQLTALPEEIGLLTQLEYLSLSWNQLKALPDSIVNLTRLREIDLQGSNNLRPDWERLYEMIPSLGTTGDNLEMIADVTIPDGTRVAIGERFVKTWRLRNTGTTAWRDGYELVHIDGPDLGVTGHEVVAEPGEEIDVSVEMTASEAGLQRSTWAIANANGDIFGFEFFVEVDVHE